MSSGSPRQLRKSLGVGQFFTLSFGTIIGVGWVIVLGEWLSQAGPLGAMLGFVGGGVIAMLVGLCYTEMTALLPVSGGEVVYAYELYGTKACFALGWFLAFAYIAVTAFEAISIGWIASTLFPGIRGTTLYVSRGSPVQLGGLLLGLGGMVLLTLLNYVGVKTAAAFQDWLTYGKIILAVVFIAAGLGWGDASNLAPLFKRDATGSVWGGVFTVFLTAPFWYGGFSIIAQVMGEKAPRTSLRAVGRMLLLSIALSAVFYCLVTLSCALAMPREQLLALNLPVAEVFTVAFQAPALTKMVLVAALLGNLTAWNSVIISASRILFAMGRAQIIRPAFGHIHPRLGSPTTAVIFTGAVASLGVWLGRSAIIPIVNVTSTCLAFGFLIVCLGVIKLRRTHPGQERPYRVPGGRATAGVAAAGSLYQIFLSLYQPYADAKGAFPLEWLFIIGWAFLGVVFWGVAHKIRGEVSEGERRKLILDASAALK